MREIKFRGKRLDNGEWVFGYYVAECGKHGILIDTSKFDGCLRRLWVEVDPATVGQFTGLHDSTKWDELTETEREAWVRSGNLPSQWKGREIYDGDIFKTICNLIASVEWDEKNGRFLGWTIDRERKIVYVAREPAVKIIGNVHENPELMEVAKS